MMLFLVLRKKRNIYNQQIEEIDKSKKRASDWNREMAYWEFSRDYAEYKNAYDSYNKCCSKIKELLLATQNPKNAKMRNNSELA